MAQGQQEKPIPTREESLQMLRMLIGAWLCLDRYPARDQLDWVCNFMQRLEIEPAEVGLRPTWLVEWAWEAGWDEGCADGSRQQRKQVQSE